MHKDYPKNEVFKYKKEIPVERLMESLCKVLIQPHLRQCSLVSKFKKEIRNIETKCRCDKTNVHVSTHNWTGESISLVYNN